MRDTVRTCGAFRRRTGRKVKPIPDAIKHQGSPKLQQIGYENPRARIADPVKALRGFSERQAPDEVAEELMYYWLGSVQKDLYVRDVQRDMEFFKTPLLPKTPLRPYAAVGLRNFVRKPTGTNEFTAV